MLAAHSIDVNQNYMSPLQNFTEIQVLSEAEHAENTEPHKRAFSIFCLCTDHINWVSLKYRRI
jgi:hypothetical protein